MHPLPHALSLELARAHEANHLAAAERRRAGRHVALAHRAAPRAGRRRRSWVPAWSVWLPGHPSV